MDAVFNFFTSSYRPEVWHGSFASIALASYSRSQFRTQSWINASLLEVNCGTVCRPTSHLLQHYPVSFWSALHYIVVAIFLKEKFGYGTYKRNGWVLRHFCEHFESCSRDNKCRQTVPDSGGHEGAVTSVDNRVGKQIDILSNCICP